jgi:diaminopimelate epimerase
VILNVGNPQCAVFVGDFDFDWRIGRGVWNGTALSESNERIVHSRGGRAYLDVRFFERGAGETMSSGTDLRRGCRGLARGLVRSP